VPEEPAFAISPPEFKKTGRITDISRGGLGYKYLEYLAPLCLDKGSQEIEIAILMSRTEFFLSRIECKLIYDFQVVEDGYTINYGMEYRRCGLQFSDLTVEQIKQIEFFFREYVTSTSL
jgi:hypothetical protein